MARSLRGSRLFSLPTPHATSRMKQRRFSPDEVRFIITYGEERYGGPGIRKYCLPCSPFASLSRDVRFSTLGGSVAVVDVARERIVTVYDRYLDETGFVDRGMI